MDSLRKPYQGLWNVVRFNWHYYVLSLVFVVLLLLCQPYVNTQFRIVANILMVLVVCATFISLAVSAYIYDCSDLYKLSWLSNLAYGTERVVNINAGFDETSVLLREKFSNAELLVIDFYSPVTHTEVSIKRARKAYPPYPGTQQVTTTHIPLQAASADKIFAILSAHEIRNHVERVIFFKEIARILKPTGQMVVTEHLRDTANFLSYNIGFMHFHSRAIWLKTFSEAGFLVTKEIKITPFITTFILQKDGAAY